MCRFPDGADGVFEAPCGVDWGVGVEEELSKGVEIAGERLAGVEVFCLVNC